MGETSSFVNVLATSIQRLDGGAHDYDGLLRHVGDARFVLIGEASHGTHEFYEERARITQRLVEERGFDAVAIEADWPDAHRVHQYVQHTSSARDANEALQGFARFPTWMWRNAEVVDFVEWLRAFNDARAAGDRKVGFFGLDLYSMYTSISAVLEHLDRIDPDAARRARDRYACFDRFDRDTSAYGYAAGLGLDASCETQVTEQLVELRRRAIEHAHADGGELAEDLFHLEANARLVKNAESYYRHMFLGGAVTWNLRDRHMADTLAAIVQHLDRVLGRPSKVVVWAHNSHLGDARATQMADEGELDLGQLARERYGRDAFLVGMTTYDGTVAAAHDWDEPPRKMNVRPALEGSYEHAFHAVGAPRFALLPDPVSSRLPSALRKERLERAIGVVYRPQTERASHWFRARIADQFDAVLHFDRTRAVTPLERSEGWHGGETPETFPFAL